MEYKMSLTPEEKGILNGSQGDIHAKVLKSIVEFGEIFGASRLVQVEGKQHFVTSFGVAMMKPSIDVINQVVEAGLKVRDGFTVDPRPDFSDMKINLLEKFIFNRKIYSLQESYEKILKKAGLLNNNAFTCTCYLDEVGNTPAFGQVLAWAESSAVVYANSVLGARCNRNSGVLEFMSAVAGKVPYYGLLTDEGRKADWIIDIKCSKRPEAQILGSAIGLKVMEDVPYIIGLDRFLGNKITPEVQAYLKDMGAASASNGAVGLYHVENLTPEAQKHSKNLIKGNAEVYVIDDAELDRVYRSYPIMWKKGKKKANLCFIGCPHLSTWQLNDWTEKLDKALNETGRKKVSMKTVMTAAP
jgi:predicted aconitase